MPDRLRVFSGSSNPELAQEIADRLYLPLGSITINKFSNENIKVKINESVRGKDVFVVQTSCPPLSDNVMELLIMLHAFKSASAGRITAVLPYFPYVRSDKKDEPRISISARLMADLLATAGARSGRRFRKNCPGSAGAAATDAASSAGSGYYSEPEAADATECDGSPQSR